MTVNNLNTVDSSFWDGLGAGIIVFIVILFIILLAAAIVILIGEAKLFKKAGKPGWAVIVPFYNTYVLIEIAGLNWWYFLIAISGTIFTIAGIKGLTFLSGIAGAVVNFFVFYNLGKKFKKEPTTYGVLGLFFSGIIAAVLGYSKNMEYDSSVEVSANGPINGGTSKTTSNEPERFCLGCGQKLKQGVQFCENCGKKVE